MFRLLVLLAAQRDAAAGGSATGEATRHCRLHGGGWNFDEVALFNGLRFEDAIQGGDRTELGSQSLVVIKFMIAVFTLIYW
jgi:hypothetical protein